MRLLAEMFTKQSMIVRVLKYSPDFPDMFAKVPGGTFVNGSNGGPGWKYILDMTTCKRLREAFGMDIEFNEEILQWGRDQEAERIRLTELSLAQNAADEELLVIQEKLPNMWPLLRDYQKAGIRFISQAKNPLVADDPGLGKTLEVIGGVFQAGMDEGPNLVVCPKMSIENVWLYELARFQDHAVFVAPEGRKQREELLEEVEFCLEVGLPFWLVINPAMLTYRQTKEERGVYDARTGHWFDTQFPFISTTKWNTLIMDEAHLSGIANPSTQTARSIAGLTVQKRIAMTGTPAGGKAQRLWGILHWLDPKAFTSRNRWSDQWLVKKKIYDTTGMERFVYTGFDREHEGNFYKAHAQHILRRKSEEVYSEMPPFVPIDITVDMSEQQQVQYRQMQDEADARIEGEEDTDGRVRSPNVLSTYSWLKQFANAYCTLEKTSEVWDDELDEWVPKYKAFPTYDSPKLEAVLTILQELDVPDGDEQVVIFTQFRTMADMVTKFLQEKKIPTDKITGGVSGRQKRAQIQSDFQAGTGAKVVVMTTRTGGVSINLDRANTVIFLDETWDPDDQTQGIGRLRRVSRVHHVTVYTIRSRNTIETQVIQKMVAAKAEINDVLLDLYRQRRNK
jgi:SNF2 family DNA or RNA helicase